MRNSRSSRSSSWRSSSLRESFLACAGLAIVSTGAISLCTRAAAEEAATASKIPFAQESVDAFYDPDLTAIDAADWKPEHAGPIKEAANEPAPEAKTPEKAADAVQKGADASDPEPDGVVVPKTPSPSHDPLDRPKPTAAAPGQPDPTKPAQAAEEPLPPLNAAIKAALDKRGAATLKGTNVAEQRKEREAVSFFYAAHGFAAAWSEGGKASPAVASVLARLAAAGEDALTLPAVPTDVKTTGTPDEIAENDIALTEAVVAYARQATGSRIEPRSISPLIGAKPDLADPAEVVDALIAAGAGAGDKLHALNPSEPRYVALRDKLAELRGEHAPKETTKIDAGPVLTIGSQDPRVPLLRARFGIEATSDEADADLVYDKAVAAAVTKFQRQNGLQPTGALGDRTVAALNGGGAAHATRPEATIIANMEMWRWLPHDLGSERIEVNVPDYMVRVYHDNQVVASNRVVVGKTGTPTPLFSNQMKFLIVNPAWNVPQSIIQNEMGGAARGFKARYIHGRLYLQQPPGPGNALGRIKFMFPNEYSVYLHDTPSKGLFGAPRRAFSHGCVRVDKPFSFAVSVLNDGVPEGGRISWSEKRLSSMLGTTERYVDLPKPLPIHIEYFTASVDNSGNLSTREDIYGYTAAVARALGLGTIGSVPVAGSQHEHARKSRYADTDPTERGTRRSRRHARYAEEGAPQGYAASPNRPSFSSAFGFLPF